MNISRENLSELELLVKIEVSPSDYMEQVAKQLKAYRRNANINGFRKGMAPMSLIERMYKEPITATEIQHVIDNSLFDYIESEKLDILGTPLANTEKTGELDLNSNENKVCYFDLALMPNIDIDWSKVDVKLLEADVVEDDINQQINDIAQRHGTYETPENVVDGAMIYGSVKELNADGTIKENGASGFLSIHIDELKDEQKALFLGKKGSETVTFPAKDVLNEYILKNNLKLTDEQIKDFNANVEMTISGIARNVPHEINEELFKTVFPTDTPTDEAAFRARVKTAIKENYEREGEMYFNSKVIEQLCNQITTPLPEAFLKRLILNNDKNITAEEVENKWSETYLPSIKRELIDITLNKIRSVEPSEADIINRVKDILRDNSNQPDDLNEEEREKQLDEAARSIIANRENIANLVGGMRSHNIYELLKEKVNPTVEVAPSDQFFKLYQ